MARKENIVSFDEAKAAPRSRRASEPSRRAPEAKRRASDKADRASEPSRHSSDKSRRTRESSSRRAPERARRTRYYEDENERTAKSRRSDSRQSETRSSRRTRSASDSKRAERNSSSEQPRSERNTKREQRRRERTKARAEKMFDAQFASEKQNAAPEEGAPRAALYETKMGRNHRKAARMQKATEAGPVSAKINPAGWLTNLNVSPRSLKIGTAVLCFVLTCLFLYTPAQQYYQSVREHDRLEAEAAIVEQRNESLDFQNDALASDAGMEDAARQKYGYVAQGDETAVVTGLSENTLDTARDSENIEANVLSSSVKAPETWYTPYLDAFFGVS